MDYKFLIAGVEYSRQDLRNASIERPLFDEFSFGNACEAQLSFRFRPRGDIPKMAEIRPCAMKDGTWAQLGVFYIDTRSVAANGLMSVVAYDGMMKADQKWVPDNSLVFPMSMAAAVTEFCRLMGVELDPRSVLNPNYTIDYPANGYTIRDVLRFIAAAHGGNWIMSNEGKLLLILLDKGTPPETHYLVDEGGRAITFGGVRILV